MWWQGGEAWHGTARHPAQLAQTGNERQQYHTGGDEGRPITWHQPRSAETPSPTLKGGDPSAPPEAARLQVTEQGHGWGLRDPPLAPGPVGTRVSPSLLVPWGRGQPGGLQPPPHAAASLGLLGASSGAGRLHPPQSQHPPQHPPSILIPVERAGPGAQRQPRGMPQTSLAPPRLGWWPWGATGQPQSPLAHGVAPKAPSTILPTPALRTSQATPHTPNRGVSFNVGFFFFFLFIKKNTYNCRCVH